MNNPPHHNSKHTSLSSVIESHGLSRSAHSAEMENPDTSPAFNLKAVVNETGLKPDTLRAWERRYGLPNPERTAGRHRLYSQYDIDTLKWLVARQEEGLSISRAVKLWYQFKENGEDPLSHKAQTVAPDTAVPSLSAAPSGDNLGALRAAWIDACESFDERQANGVLTEAFSLFPLDLVCFDLLQKGLAEIGQGWYEGRISVQQEHFASAMAMRRLDTDGRFDAPPYPSRPYFGGLSARRAAYICPAADYLAVAPQRLGCNLLGCRCAGRSSRSNVRNDPARSGFVVCADPLYCE